MSQIRKGLTPISELIKAPSATPLPPIKLSLQHGIRENHLRLCVLWLSGTFFIQLSSFRSQTILPSRVKAYFPLKFLFISMTKFIPESAHIYLFWRLAGSGIRYSMLSPYALSRNVLKLGTLVYVQKHFLNHSSNYAKTPMGSAINMSFPSREAFWFSPWKPHQRECGQNAPLMNPPRGG